MKDQKLNAVKRDILISIVFIFIGILAIVKINMGDGTKSVHTATLTHATLPTIYGALMIFLAGMILLGALRKLLTGRRGPGPERVNPQTDAVVAEVSRATVMLRTWGTLVLLVTYSFLLPHVNFIVLTAAFLALLFFLYGRRNVLHIALFSLLGSAGFYMLFIYFLNLPM